MIKVNLHRPNTHKGADASGLIGQLVKARPYYHVPSGPSSLTSARSPWAYEAQVVREGGLSDMVIVRFTWDTDSAPWPREQLFYVSELHRAYRACECPACSYLGSGIHEHSGA